MMTSAGDAQAELSRWSNAAHGGRPRAQRLPDAVSTFEIERYKTERLKTDGISTVTLRKE